MASRELYARFFQVGSREVDKHSEAKLHSLRRRRRRRHPTITKEDLFSKLPDDILLRIIPFLPIKEGAATCVLSKRWRNLWRESVTSLNFTGFNVLGFKHTRNIFELKKKEFPRFHWHIKRKLQGRNVRMRPIKRKGFLEIQRTRFIKQVNQILQLRSASKMDRFRVSFPLGKESASHLDRWMKLAAAQGVKKLELNFDWECCSSRSYSGYMYYFPFHEFGSSLNYLSLRYCNLKFPRCFRGLNSLVSLSLEKAFFTEDILQTILSGCPRLEFLRLRQCLSCYPITLKFIGPSLILKHLYIGACFNVVRIQLQDVNLLSFELLTCESKLSINNAPCLTRLALGTSFGGSVETLINVPGLETLLVKHEVHLLPELNALSNLKRLVFCVKYDRSNLFQVLDLVEACPSLQQLHIDMGIHTEWHSVPMEESEKIITRPGCAHHVLKEIEIHEFNGHPEQIEFARYLLRNSMVLEKMKLHTSCRRYKSKGVWMLCRKDTMLTPPMKFRDLLLKEKQACTKLLLATPIV